MPSINKTFLHLIIIAGVVILIGWPSLFNNFTDLDDPQQLINNPNVRSLDWPHLQKIFTDYTLGMYQPLATLSFAIEYKLWGINAVASHALNLILHIINAGLVYYLALLILKKKGQSLAMALLFAVHPVQVETVAWTSARSNLLLVLFYLGAVIIYIKNIPRPKKMNYLWLIICFILALLAKAPAVTLPLVLLAVDYFFQRLSWRLIIDKLFLLSPSAVFAFITLIGKNSNYSFRPEDYNWASRLTLIPLSFYNYLQTIILPVNLKLFYAFPEAHHGWLKPELYLSWLIVIIGALWLYRWRRRRLFIFGALWFLIAILPHLPFLPANQIITADRYLYLAGIGLSFIMLDIYQWLLTKLPTRVKLLQAALIIYFVCLAVIACLRFVSWGDSIGLMKESSDNAPWSGLLRYHLALAYYERGYYQEALTASEESFKLDRSNAYAYFLSANILIIDRHDYLSAINRFNEAVKLAPSYAMFYYGRGYCLTQMKNYHAALIDFRLAERFNHDNPELAGKIAKALAQVTTSSP